MGFGDNPLKISAFTFAGLSMMLNIRLVYSAAPYALLRFKFPENLFSVFVRVMASSLELWCLPSMTIANIMEQVYNNTQDNVPEVHANNLKNAYENLKQKATALYNAANRLGAAYDNLKNAVGAQDQEGNVGSPNTLREALHQLANATPEELTSKACAVTSQYEEVKGLFAQVEGQDTNKKYDSYQSAYQAVVDAMSEFDNVYKPEELLATAANGLKGALTALAAADILVLHTRAEEVKKNFEGFGPSVISKFGLVQDQVEAYSSDGSNIKDQHYELLKSAYDDFNKLYRKAIYPTKFYSIIVVLSIISMLSDWSQKIEFLLHLSLYRFGGCTGYNANKFEGGKFEQGVPVYAWIWHFFDIIH